MIVSGPWCGFLLSRIQKHFPQPKRRGTLPPAPILAVEEVEEEGHDELPEEHSAWSDVAGDGEVEQEEEEQEQHEEVVEQEEESHEELPELPEEHSAWSDDGQHGEVEQEEESHEREEQEQHEEVEQEEEGHEEQEAVEVEVEVEVEGEDEVEGGGDGDDWSDFSSRDPVLTLSLFGAVCFRACGTITLNLST